MPTRVENDRGHLAVDRWTPTETYLRLFTDAIQGDLIGLDQLKSNARYISGERSDHISDVAGRWERQGGVRNNKERRRAPGNNLQKEVTDEDHK